WSSGCGGRPVAGSTSPSRRRFHRTDRSKYGWMTSCCSRGSRSITGVGTRMSASSWPTNTRWSSSLACDPDRDAVRAEQRPSQLPLRSISPAVQHQPAGQPTRERSSGVHVRKAQPPADEGGGGPIDLGAVAELAAGVGAPAIGETVGGDAARVLPAGGDGAKGESARYVGRHLHERVGDSSPCL